MKNQIRVRKTLFFFALFLLGQYLYAQPQPNTAPINPEFTKYQEKNKSENLVNTSINGRSLGYIPSPVSYHYSTRKLYKKVTQFALVYDLRSLALVTPVKNQGTCGDCWAFASLGSVESNWLKNLKGAFDLSEQNLRTCVGFENGPCGKGNADMVAAYLTRFSGPVSESDDTYNEDSTATCHTNLPLFAYVAEYHHVSQDSTAVKQAILDYGAVTAGIYYTDASFNSGNNTYYYNGSESINHLVLLVGWNDNKITAGGTGAWIAKNSWGESWGENGFFYISYNDSTVLNENAYFPKTIWDSTFFVCGYEKLGAMSAYGWGNETGYGLTKFKTYTDQKIVSVGTIVNTAGINIDIEIFHNFSGGILSNSLGSLSGQTSTFPGYCTFNLTTPIIIAANDSFYVKVKYNTPGYNYPVPLEAKVTDYSNPTIVSGVNWVSYNGNTWTVLGSEFSRPYNLCIKYGATQNNLIGIKETDSSANYFIYPNPAQNVLTVEQKQKQTADILILNITGQIMIHKQTSQSKTRIDIGNFAKGIYIIKLTTENTLITKKIIKE